MYHLHRRDYASLQKQIYHYGTGFVAYLLKSVLDTPGIIVDLITKLPFDFISILNSRLSKNSKRSSDYPKELDRLEMKGRLYGLFAYIQSRREVRSMHAPQPTLEAANLSSDAV